MPPTIYEIIENLENVEVAKHFFDSAFDKGNSRDLRVFRKYLIDNLFNNRNEALEVADNKAFIFTCLRLKHNLDTEVVYEMMAEDPKYLIGLGYRDRYTFDAFLENPKDVPLGKLTAGEEMRIKLLEEELKLKREKFSNGSSKTEYWSLSRGTEWINSMKVILWRSFYLAYLGYPSKFEPYSETRKLFSSFFDGNACFVCLGKFEDGNKIYVSQSKFPLRKVKAKHSEAVPLCNICIEICIEKKIAPVDVVNLQNLAFDNRKIINASKYK